MRRLLALCGISLLLATMPLGGEAAAAGLELISKGPATQPFGDRLRVHSEALGHDMIVTVTPPLTGLRKGRKVAALYALDEGYGVAGPAGSAMSGAEVMAPVLVVAVGWVPGQWNRRDDDLFYGTAMYDGRLIHGRGEQFERFLLDELKPYIEAQYPADPASAVLFGHSAAGTFATEILVQRPDAFSGFVIASPAARTDSALIDAARNAARAARPKRVFIAVGGAESPQMRGYEARLTGALSGPGSRLAVREHTYQGARHAAYFTPLFADSFPWVLPPEPAIAVSPAALKEHAGRYLLDDGRRVEIIARGDQLFLRLPERLDRELRPTGDGEFAVQELSIEVRFAADAIRVKTNGAEVGGRRLR